MKSAATTFTGVDASGVTILMKSSQQSYNTQLEVGFVMTQAATNPSATDVVTLLQNSDGKPLQDALDTAISGLASNADVSSSGAFVGTSFAALSMINKDGETVWASGTMVLYVPPSTSQGASPVTATQTSTQGATQTVTASSATATATSTQAPSPSTTLKASFPNMTRTRVKQRVTLKNMDFDKLEANPTLKTAIVTNVKQSYLSVLPEGYTENHIIVTLSKGSVIATVEIIPAEGVTTADLETSFTDENVKTSLESKVLKNLQAVENVNNVMEEGKTAADLTATASAPISSTPSTSTGTDDDIQGLVVDLGIRASIQPLMIALTIGFQTAYLL
jgi:hypothetical protein